MSDDVPAFTPVTVLTGFLGSGKTTLLKRLLADPALADTAVIINEFGEVGIDHLLVERLDEEVVLLASGCLCCTVRGELSTSMRDLLSKRTRGDLPPFRRLVIETTGLADPFPVLSTLSADPVLRHHFRAAAVVTTVDAVNGLGQLSRHAESLRQAAIADRIVLTKTDIAEPGAVSDLKKRLRRIAPDAPILEAAAEGFNAGALLAPTGSSSFRAFAEARPFTHSDIRAFTIETDQPVDWTAFGVWLTLLLHRHGGRILRVKGILALEGEARPVAVHGVQHLVHPPAHLEGWPAGERRSRLVFIAEGIEPELVRRSFRLFTRAGAPAEA